MNCACRTAPVRLFVQGLTGLRVTDSAVTRSARRIHLGFPAVAQLAPSRSSSRPFSAASALALPRHKWWDSPDSPLPSRTEEAPIQTTSNVPSEDLSAILPLHASRGDLDQAKRDGFVFDLSPDSIDTLVTDLEQTTVQDHTPANVSYTEPIDELGLRMSPEMLNMEGSEIHNVERELKRRKIIKKQDTEQKRGRDEHWTPKKEAWQVQREVLKEKFPEGWQPRKRLSPDACEGIRALHAQFPEQYPLWVLSEQFQISPEAVRRILRSKWRASPEEEMKRQDRWFSRGKRIWSQMAALGKKPPKKWREEGIVRDPYWNVKRGPRTEWPYMPHREPSDEDDGESPQRKLSENLL
ncbi:hypothetical protein F5X99DRAFT_364475 [Biscogniauxia marginata]|nr:hypothetical protein F5X99DRAFT_364475 [Biscogniauxia marginata]